MPENAKHRHAFDAYWMLGSERTIEQLHAVLRGEGRAPSRRTLFEWSRTYRWQERLARIEEEAKRAEDDCPSRGLA